MKKICVYCGSSSSVENKYKEKAFNVGVFLAQQGIELIYGGGNIGTMKSVADGAMHAGGFVTGVIPDKLAELELAHPGIQQLYTTQGMHERKSLMAQLSDGFIALPGGYGTLEELAEISTWSQLNIHRKPVGLYNIFGFYDHLLQWIDHAHQEEFIRKQHRGLIVHDSDIEALIQKMKTVQYIDLIEVL